MLCGRERDGIEIREDNVIKAIRWLNRSILHKVRDNKIVICRDCYERYRKQRKRYVSRQRLYIILGLLLDSSILIHPTISTFGLGVLLLLFLYLLSLLSYTPDLKVDAAATVSTGKRGQKRY